MKILFVNAAVSMSISDVARGYRSALINQGHEVADYDMQRRMSYHFRALPPEVSSNVEVLARFASETIVVEAMTRNVDVVVIISGLNVHPVALWLLGKIGVPIAVVLTESPYDDEPQAEWTSAAKMSSLGSSPNITVFTNDRFSASKFDDWHLLPPAFDVAVHKPLPHNPELASDVLIIGTGWVERQMFLEAVDWSGIDLQIFGVWPRLGDSPDSPIYKYYRPLVVNNEHAVEMYSSAKICLNFHRSSLIAQTPNPRTYELAACGAFQLSDSRPDLVELFGDSIPTFRNPAELGQLVRYYLNYPEARAHLASLAMERVKNETFDRRAADMIAVLTGGNRDASVGILVAK